MPDSLPEVIPLLRTPHTLLHSRAVCHTGQLMGHLQYFSLDVTAIWLTGEQVSQLHKIVLSIPKPWVLAQSPLQTSHKELWINLMDSQRFMKQI